MDKEAFLKEIAQYSDTDLETIIETQKDLYSEEELEIMKQESLRLKAEKERILMEKMPKEITCPKCSGKNPFSDDKCEFCGFDMRKEKEKIKTRIAEGESAEGEPADGSPSKAEELNAYRADYRELDDKSAKEYLMFRNAKNINTIKNCVVFFTVMTIIGMVAGAIMAIVALSKLF
ncbi:MAG: hypothetical protein K6G89_00355 [Clostridia bacterium]|nr:hypothetical protein [Clostridia bacterium]